MDGPTCDTLLVLAHGAGAGMRHAFMEALAAELLIHDIATFRFNFPYAELGKRVPDRQPVLEATVAAALDTAGELSRGRPLFCGGKSMGGRMTSLLLAKGPPEDRTPKEETPAGVVYFGFPLHRPKKPSTARAQHLSQISIPQLFLQGTRDALSDLELLRAAIDEIGPSARLHLVEGADHGFAILKRSGRTAAGVLAELAAIARTWVSANSAADSVDQPSCR